jgi:hypothetical protein
MLMVVQVRIEGVLRTHEKDLQTFWNEQSAEVKRIYHLPAGQHFESSDKGSITL